MRSLLCAVALATLGGCASTRDAIISGFCGADASDQEHWTRIDPPPVAYAYRVLANANAATPRSDGAEYWFASTGGDIKYCVTPLRRASTVPERNGSNCDDRIGVWWVFHQTPSGPVTNGANERVCLT